MTRINPVPVTWLTDQHLLIEHREITRVSTLARPLKPKEHVPEYRLGPGHVKFFYDKGLYLHKRLDELYKECCARNFNVEQKLYRIHPSDLHFDWTPSVEDMLINLARLDEKIHMRPGFYKYHGQTVEDTWYHKFIFDLETIHESGIHGNPSRDDGRAEARAANTDVPYGDERVSSR